MRRDHHHISRLPVNIDRLRKQITKKTGGEALQGTPTFTAMHPQNSACVDKQFCT